MTTKLFLIALMFAPGLTFGQSLGDAARQAEEARRANVGSPSPVYTLRRSGTPTQPAPQALPAMTMAPASPITMPMTTGRDEGYWKDRMRFLEARLHDDEMRLAAAIRTRRELQQRVYVVSTGDGTRTWCCYGVAEAIAAVNDAAAAVANSSAAITRLENEARIAGVPPGWLRPLQTR